jgi:hypothetical protein
MTDPFEIREPVAMTTATVLQFTGHKRCNDVHTNYDGALYRCFTCHGAEGDLPTHCPGKPMRETQRKAVMLGELDYKDGQWVLR